MTLGEKIHDLRIRNNMTMEDLASQIGVQRSAVNKYEKGIVVNLKRSTIVSLCRVFSVPPSYFLEDDVDPTLSPEELLLVEHFRLADAGTRNAVCKLLDIPESDQKSYVSESSVI